MSNREWSKIRSCAYKKISSDFKHASNFIWERERIGIMITMCHRKCYSLSEFIKLTNLTKRHTVISVIRTAISACLAARSRRLERVKWPWKTWCQYKGLLCDLPQGGTIQFQKIQHFNSPKAAEAVAHCSLYTMLDSDSKYIIHLHWK